jgi:hypothetical protein
MTSGYVRGAEASSAIATALGILALGAVVAGVVAAGSAAQGEGGAEPLARDAPWRLVGVGRDGSTLRLVHDVSGCWWRSPGVASVSETPDSVEISVRQERPGPPPGEEEACPAIAGIARVSARLEAPVDGRALRGGPRIASWCCFFDRTTARPGENPDYVPRVPRVIGLARGDAVSALKVQRFRVRTRPRRTGGQVLAQDPAPGAAIRDWKGQFPVATVRLKLRRR